MLNREIKSNETNLNLSDSNLTSFPTQIFNLSQLISLNLKNNKIEKISPQIVRLKSLTALNLSRNNLTSIPPELGDLKEITILNLSGNNLKELPIEIQKLKKLCVLNLTGNPLSLPPEILDQTDNPAAILNYYFEHRTGNKLPLNEAKVLLVGQGSVGKTSLVKRLVNNLFDPLENKTEGIDIKNWRIEVNSKNMKLNLWDFGGQEIMHATHQFFLTKRSLYILVINSRQSEEDNRLEYWIKIIESFGSGAPIIIVGNKSDQHQFDLDKKGLKKKYIGIKGFIETSCVSGYGIKELKEKIKIEINNLEHVHDELLETWFRVKDKLDKMKRNFISYEEYIRLCQNEGIDKEQSQKTLIGFLHDLGIVLNFQDDPRLFDTNVLNPEWVTNGVYKILNSNVLFQNKGVLKLDDLSDFLDKKEYPKTKQIFLIDLMRKFELCFKFEGFNDKRYLIPGLLSKEEPETGEWNNAISFQYHYNVLPVSIISRFIVRMNKFISKNTYWRTGVVLKKDTNKSLVKADIEEKKISIWIKGQDNSQREFLSVIRSHFDTIHDNIPKLFINERVVLPGHPSVTVSYPYLLRLEQQGINTFIPEELESGEAVDLKQLLDGVDQPAKRKIIKNVEVPVENKNDVVEQVSEKKENNENEVTQRATHLWEKIVACIFGFLFVSIMIFIAISFPNPTGFQIFIFRIVLALAASGIGAVVPGFLNIEWKEKHLPFIRAGGAITLFVIIYLLNPPALIE